MAGPVLRQLDLVRTQTRSSELCPKGLGPLWCLTLHFPSDAASQVFPVPTLTAHSEQWPNLTCGLRFHGPKSQVQIEPSDTLLRAVQVGPSPRMLRLKCFGFFWLVEYLHTLNIVGMGPWSRHEVHVPSPHSLRFPYTVF